MAAPCRASASAAVRLRCAATAAFQCPARGGGSRGGALLLTLRLTAARASACGLSSPQRSSRPLCGASWASAFALSLASSYPCPSCYSATGPTTSSPSRSRSFKTAPVPPCSVPHSPLPAYPAVLGQLSCTALPVHYSSVALSSTRAAIGVACSSFRHPFGCVPLASLPPHSSHCGRVDGLGSTRFTGGAGSRAVIAFEAHKERWVLNSVGTVAGGQDMALDQDMTGGSSVLQHSGESSKKTPAALHVKESNGLELAGTASIAVAIWRRCTREALQALHHPFVVKLAAGTLPASSFQHYIAQDAFFLQAFHQSYQLAKELVVDEEDKATLDLQLKAVVEEAQLHTAYAHAWGVDPALLASPNPATLAYTTFLLHTASQSLLPTLPEAHQGPSSSDLAATDGPASESRTSPVCQSDKDDCSAYWKEHAARTIAVMTPCMRLYAFLGHSLKVALAAELEGPYRKDHHRYRDWIDTYASSEFQASAARLEGLLDKLSKDLPPEALETLSNLYDRAMQLELQFFSAQCTPSARASKPIAGDGGSMPMHSQHEVCRPEPSGPGKTAAAATWAQEAKPDQYRGASFILATDFDSTCTEEDSSPVLAEVAIDAARALQGNARRAADMTQAWKSVNRRYASEYAELLDERLGQLNGKPNGASLREPDWAGLRKFMDVLSVFERAANTTVEASGVLEGMPEGALYERGRAMPLRPGCAETLERQLRGGGGVKVVSVSWSKKFIHGALAAVLEMSNGRAPPESVQVEANELTIGSSGTTTGAISWAVQTPLDKLEAVQGLRLQSTAMPVVYVGDSVTDLLALLEADVGIVIGENRSLARVCNAFGIRMEPLIYASVLQARSADGGKCAGHLGGGLLFQATSWLEVGAFLFRASGN